MEDSKNCGTSQSPRGSTAFSNKPSGQSGHNIPETSRSLPCHPPFSRPPSAMASQHPIVNGAQSQSDNTWATTTEWEQNSSIADSIAGTNGQAGDYNGGRTLDWDVKASPWDWDNMGVLFQGRGESHGSKSSFSVGLSSESAALGGNLVHPDSRSSFPLSKSLSDTRNSSVLDQNRTGNLGGAGSVGAVSQQSSMANAFEQQQRKLYFGLGGASGVDEGRKVHGQEQSNGCASTGRAGDSLIGLKLGVRTYFEDSTGRAGGGTVYAASPPGKKQRVQSPGAQVARCQVEGCKQDLSSAKDYHRRHKVCESHSKATKVIAQGKEQRFCQQCSRFHLLAEFDEGKRSCRRRLAGHNERRRKPQPESAAIASSGSSSALHADSGSHATSANGEEEKRVSNGLTERACFLPLQQRTPGSSSTSVEDSDDHSGSLGTGLKLNQGKGSWHGLGRVEDSSGLACQLQVAGGERQPYLSTPTPDRLLMLLQSPKSQMAGAPQFLLEGSGPLGPGLTLSSSSGPAGVLSGLDTPASPAVSGLTDSGRALSLLSSHSWGSRGDASGSVSLDLSTRSDVTLEQLISENSGAAFSPRGQPSHYHTSSSATVEKLFPLQPHSQREMGISSNSSLENRNQHRGFLSGLVGSFENHPMLALMQGQSDFRAMQGSVISTQRPTIDLMQLPSPQPHSNSNNPHSSNGQFSEFPAMRAFESSSLYDAQQMLQHKQFQPKTTREERMSMCPL